MNKDTLSEMNLLYLDVRRSSRISTDKLFKENSKIPLTVLQVADNAHHLADDSIDAVTKVSPPTTPLACKVSCAHCCHFPVTVLAPEVFRIVDYLRTTISPPKYEEVKQRIVALAELVRDKTSEQRHGIPCALLEDNKCSVYAVRPLTCRGHNSTDATKCEEAKTNPKARIPVYHPQRETAIAILQQVQEGIRLNALKTDELDLAFALPIAITTPQATEQWLAGEDTFREAKKKRSF